MPSSSFGTAVYVVVAMSAAGLAHSLWLRTSFARSWSASVDFGLRVGGQRLFGENKKVRGFVVMPPATALAFAGIAAWRPQYPAWLADGIWPLGWSELAGLGFAAGLGFMLAELPNSFLKRRLAIAPGQAPSQGWLQAAFLVIDRIDSALGALLAIELFAPVAAMTWLWSLLLGVASHATFSVLLYGLSVKSRPL
jgi:hypothetical protein